MIPTNLNAPCPICAKTNGLPTKDSGTMIYEFRILYNIEWKISKSKYKTPKDLTKLFSDIGNGWRSRNFRDYWTPDHTHLGWFIDSCSNHWLLQNSIRVNGALTGESQNQVKEALESLDWSPLFKPELATVSGLRVVVVQKKEVAKT